MADNRGLKNRTAISTAIDKNLYQQLKDYSDETSIPISKLLDKAIKLFLDSIKQVPNLELIFFINISYSSKVYYVIYKVFLLLGNI